MGVSLNQPRLWKADIQKSVDMYNTWFMKFAPKAFRDTRILITQKVADTLKEPNKFTNIRPRVFRENPLIIPTLRTSTYPPIARDRLIGLAGVPKGMIDRMENEGKLPVKLNGGLLDAELRKVAKVIMKLADRDIFVWLDSNDPPSKTKIIRTATNFWQQESWNSQNSQENCGSF